MIRAPKKVYLDTNHVIEIAKVRRGESRPLAEIYVQIDQLIRGAACGLVYSEFSSLEWVEGAATEGDAQQIAAVFDSAPLVYEIEDDTMIWTAEVLAELGRMRPDIGPLELPPIYWHRRVGQSMRRALSVIVERVPEYIDPDSFVDGPPLGNAPPSTRQTPTFDELAQAAASFRRRRPKAYAERRIGFSAAVQNDVHLFQRGDSLSDRFPDWAIQMLRMDRILARLLPEDDPRLLLRQVDLVRCPGVCLWFRAWEKRLCKGTKMKDDSNAVHDWGFVAAIPYVDIVLTERRLRSILHEADSCLRSKVTSNPEEALARIRS